MCLFCLVYRIRILLFVILSLYELMDQESREINGNVSTSSARLEAVIDLGESEIDDSNLRTKGRETAQMEEKLASSCVIYMNSTDPVVEIQKICRICHLNAKESERSLNELIELGCQCKGELGVAHSDCAEAWFRVRGNRLCEICGNIAQNIKGISDNGFMMAWNENRSTDAHNASPDSRRCFRGQPLCNFLMACLVIAFVLPWFFRENMF